MDEDYKPITDSEEASAIAKGCASKFRVKFIEILMRAENHEMLLSDLIKECSSDPEFYIVYTTANFHLTKMHDAGLVEIEDITLPMETQEGRLKIQSLVRLKKDVKLFIKDL